MGLVVQLDAAMEPPGFGFIERELFGEFRVVPLKWLE
jgi:hypothetical protein